MSFYADFSENPNLFKINQRIEPLDKVIIQK